MNPGRRRSQSIDSARGLARTLAEHACRIRDRINHLFKGHPPSGGYPHADADLGDAVAQTVVHGVLAARVSQLSAQGLDELLALILPTGVSLDRAALGVEELRQRLDAPGTELTAILADFGKHRPEEEPILHFYEHFLKEYDPGQRMRRGVFYTPRPVVRYIVRSVHETLRTEFALEDGLADTTTWAEMQRRHRGPTQPERVNPEEAVVQVLDPATGTGAFLVEIIDLVHQTMQAQWQSAGHSQSRQARLWNEYVPRYLLPRMHGFELLPAPYVLAHLNVGLKLAQTGYRVPAGQRARIYLTNTLDPPENGFATLACKLGVVDRLKTSAPVTVILGNPPYAQYSANLSPAARSLIDKYKWIDGQRVIERNALQLERNLNDDYVKFLAWAEDRLARLPLSVLAVITNNGLLASPSLRGLRRHLWQTFPRIDVLNLHGAAQRGPADACFSLDENVFDIEQPVAVTLFRRGPDQSPDTLDAGIRYAEHIGPRAQKYERLLATPPTADAERFQPAPPQYRFLPRRSHGSAEYESWPALPEIFELFAEGIKTGRDGLVVDFTAEPILARMRDIQTSTECDDDLCARLQLPRKKTWNFEEARRFLRGARLAKHITDVLYRPFDMRRVFYQPNWVASPSRPVMAHLQPRLSNLCLLAGRTSRDPSACLIWCSAGLTDKSVLSSLDNVSVFPLLVNARNPQGRDGTVRVPNLSASLMAILQARLFISFEVPSAFGLEECGLLDFFHYVYAVMWSPTYRQRYRELLAAEFPRVPLPAHKELFVRLATLGADLVALHLLESGYFAASWNRARAPNLLQLFRGKLAGTGSIEVAKDHPRYEAGRVFINPRRWFAGVPENVWNLRVGGYQVCAKWLRDRRGRTLSREDVRQYRRIVAALGETLRLAAAIDAVIDGHGGWPAAFRPRL